MLMLLLFAIGGEFKKVSADRRFNLAEDFVVQQFCFSILIIDLRNYLIILELIEWVFRIAYVCDESNVKLESIRLRPQRDFDKKITAQN
jgi:hypothetical protein